MNTTTWAATHTLGITVYICLHWASSRTLVRANTVCVPCLATLNLHLCIHSSAQHTHHHRGTTRRHIIECVVVGGYPDAILLGLLQLMADIIYGRVMRSFCSDNCKSLGCKYTGGDCSISDSSHAPRFLFLCVTQEEYILISSANHEEAGY